LFADSSHIFLDRRGRRVVIEVAAETPGSSLRRASSIADPGFYYILRSGPVVSMEALAEHNRPGS